MKLFPFAVISDPSFSFFVILDPYLSVKTPVLIVWSLEFSAISYYIYGVAFTGVEQ